MKIIYLFVFVFAGCNEQQATQQPPSTVDSNTINTGDSTPAILHLDDARLDTSFTIALDSVVPSVDAKDTINK